MNIQNEKGFNNEVAETRRLVIEREHAALLIWGVTTFAVGMLIFLLQYFWSGNYGILWIALPIIACPIQYFADKKADRKSGKKLTNGYRTLRRIGIVANILILATALLTLVYDFNAYLVIMLILTSWVAFTGFMLNYPMLLALTAGGFGFSILMRTMYDSPYILPIFTTGAAMLLIVSGLDMYKHSVKKQYT